METNEALKRTLMSVAEKAIEQLVLSMQELTEGDLQELEQQIMVQIMVLGRNCLEQILEHQAKREGSAARREGSCGHRQRAGQDASETPLDAAGSDDDPSSLLPVSEKA